MKCPATGFSFSAELNTFCVKNYPMIDDQFVFEVSSEVNLKLVETKKKLETGNQTGRRGGTYYRTVIE